MGGVLSIQRGQPGNKKGRHYAYVDTLAEARRLFVVNLTSTLQVIGRDAKVQVDFNPDMVSRYRLIGYENRDVADEISATTKWMPESWAPGTARLRYMRWCSTRAPRGGWRRSNCAGKIRPPAR